MQTDTLSRVAILEDDDDMRGYLSTIINQTQGLELVFASDCVADALKQCAVHKMDICLVDLQLPDGSGLKFVQRAKALHDSKTLILTILGDRKSVLMALKAGANGYLLKDTGPDQIKRNIQATLRGESPISPQAATHLLQMFLPHNPVSVGGQTVEALTLREKDILNMFARGLSYKETATALEISHHTVGDYVKTIYRKLSVNSRNEALFEANQLGLID